MKSRYWLHPFLFAAFPVLALLAGNIAELHLESGLRALAVSILGAAILFGLLRLALGDWQTAAILVTTVLIFIFSYGHLYNYLKSVPIFGIALGRHRYLLPLYAVLLALALVGEWRYRLALPRVTEALNVIGGFLVIISAFQLAAFELRALRVPDGERVDLAAQYGVAMPNTGQTPDVYFIILDGYARDDQLAEQLNFDNTPFLEEMRALGFYVPQCNRSNYTLTQLSLTSTMNFTYLEDLGLGLQRDALLDTAVFDTTIRRDSRVLKIFEQLGYSTVAFETGFRWTEIESADYFFSPNQGWLERIRSGNGLNAFEALFVRTTVALPLFEERLVPVGDGVEQDQVASGDRVHYELVRYVFDKLETIPDISGPKFIFAHLVVPHEPYVFAADGSFTPTDNVKEGYAEQIRFVNGRVVEMVQVILAQSDTPPVIILQADHGGPYLDTPDRIFPTAAYYFPGASQAELEALVTPVNLFRFVFNEYFGAELPLLENKSYFSTYYWPYDFAELGELRAGCEAPPQ